MLGSAQIFSALCEWLLNVRVMLEKGFPCQEQGARLSGHGDPPGFLVNPLGQAICRHLRNEWSALNTPHGRAGWVGGGGGVEGRGKPSVWR